MYPYSPFQDGDSSSDRIGKRSESTSSNISKVTFKYIFVDGGHQNIDFDHQIKEIHRPSLHFRPCRNIPAGVIFIRGIMRFHVAVRRFVSADLPSAARAERNFQSCIPFSRPDKGKPLSERNEVQKRNLSFFGDSPARTAH